MPFSRLLFILILLAFPVALSGCGGSSSSTPPPSTGPTAPPPPPPPPPPEDSPFNTAEFRFSWGLGHINPIPAYEEGGTGQGIRVAVIDSGFNTTHVDLDTVYHSASQDVIANRGIDGDDFHGAQVAGVVAAEKNGQGMHGVAFNSKIIALRTDEPGSCAEEDCNFFVSDIVTAIDIAISAGAHVINISLGGTDVIPPNFTEALRRAAQAGIFVAISAGNDGNAIPDGLARALGEPGVLGNGLAVGAISENNIIASFSNKAGSARGFYVVAPGVRVRTTGSGDTFPTVSGTSFAAPHVSGAAAVLFSLFPNLDGRDIFDILTQTATDLGPVGVDATYGHGLINIGAAIQPLGNLSFPTAGTDSNDTETVPEDDTGAGFSFAFGDAFSRIPELARVMMLDGFERSYMVNLTSRLTPAFDRSLSLESVLEARKRTQTLYFPVSSNAGFSFAYYDRHRDLRPIADSLSMAARTQLYDEVPASHFHARLGEKTGLSLAYGFSPGEILQRGNGLSRPGYDFLAARFDATPYLAFSQAGRTLAVSRQSGTKARLTFGVYSGTYRLPDELSFLASQPEAKALGVFGQASHRLGRLSLSLTGGVLDETNALLGTLSSGALNVGGGAQTLFASLQGRLDLGRGVVMLGQYESGWTSVDGLSRSFFSGISDFRTSSFSAMVMKYGVFGRNDRLGIGIHQPLRVENGMIGLRLPTGRDYTIDRILFSDASAPLVPSARELDLELSYRMNFESGFTLEVNLIHQFNPGHTVSLKHADAFLVRLVRPF